MQSAIVDLHIHSTCSDGYLSPEEVVRQAQRVGLAAVALADHDNIDGIARAIQVGTELDIIVLAGMELSTQWYHFSDMHLLGYGFDYQDPYLVRALQEFQEFRRQRNRQIIAKINQKLAGEQRQPLVVEQVQQLAGGTIGRPH